MKSSGDAVSGDAVNGDAVSRDAMSGDTVNGDAGNGTDMNAVSTVLYLEYEDFTAIFTGDLEGKGETSLMRILTDRGLSGQAVTVLKVAHHGSKNSTSQDFLDEVRPRVSVLSAGRRNKYGPHKELLDRLDAVGTRRLCTIDEGAVIVKVEGEKITVRGFSEYNE
jgi:competence protein ComEC